MFVRGRARALAPTANQRLKILVGDAPAAKKTMLCIHILYGYAPPCVRAYV